MFINHINIYNYLYRVLIYKKLIMSIILNNSNITVDYRTSNFNIETVKSDIYVKDINLENNISKNLKDINEMREKKLQGIEDAIHDLNFYSVVYEILNNDLKDFNINQGILYQIDDDYRHLYSVQPCIWKTKSFLTL